MRIHVTAFHSHNYVLNILGNQLFAVTGESSVSRNEPRDSTFFLSWCLTIKNGRGAFSNKVDRSDFNNWSR
jgi:hypothetical protein